MERLTEEQIEEALQQAEGWKRTDEKWIEKRYRFKEFLSGVDFVNEVAKLAEDANHHPFISIDFKVVTLKMSSWTARGLTDLDFQLARQFNDVYDQKG